MLPGAHPAWSKAVLIQALKLRVDFLRRGQEHLERTHPAGRLREEPLRAFEASEALDVQAQLHASLCWPARSWRTGFLRRRLT